MEINLITPIACEEKLRFAFGKVARRLAPGS